MIRHYRPVRRRSRITKTLTAFLPSLTLVLLGSAGFYGAMQWLRKDAVPSHAEVATPVESQVTATATESETSPEPTIAVLTTAAAPIVDSDRPQETTAALISAFDSQSTGRVTRYASKQSADFTVLTYLPALDPSFENYHVWLLKDGLADVKDMGQLSPRADGSWVLSFTAGAAAGIVDPATYNAVVITKEPNDDNSAPSGNKMAEARF
jgi:hypothetical protein